MFTLRPTTLTLSISLRIVSHVDSNWLVAGDFNLARNADENSNGTLHQNLAELFNDPIHALAVIEIPLLDCLFTWSYHRAEPTLPRLDRVFFNNSFFLRPGQIPV